MFKYKGMRCEDIEKVIVDYLDKKLEPAIEAGVEQHVANCERCLDEMRETKKILETISLATTQQPDESLQLNFTFMLDSEKARQASQKSERRINKPNAKSIRPLTAVAAGLALLLGGSIIGILLNSSIAGSRQADELSLLRSQVDELRKTAMISLLKETSSSSRIEAVNFSEDISEPDENIIAALTSTLNNDRNVNVRLTAAYALSKYGSLGQVRDSLVNSLSLQKDPIVQVTLINILVELKEKSALRKIKQIINDKNTINEVRSVAESGARQLL